MAEITLTVRQIINLGIWDKVCEYKEYNPWILTEGRIEEDDYITFDDEFKREEVADIDYGEFKVICPKCNSDNTTVHSHSITCDNCGYAREI